MQINFYSVYILTQTHKWKIFPPKHQGITIKLSIQHASKYNLYFDQIIFAQLVYFFFFLKQSQKSALEKIKHLVHVYYAVFHDGCVMEVGLNKFNRGSNRGCNLLFPNSDEEMSEKPSLNLKFLLVNSELQVPLSSASQVKSTWLLTP